MTWRYDSAGRHVIGSYTFVLRQAFKLTRRHSTYDNGHGRLSHIQSR